MVDPDKIGTTEYSKILDRNFQIIEGPSDEYYKLIGLGHVLIEETKREKVKFPKVDPNTASDSE